MNRRIIDVIILIIITVCIILFIDYRYRISYLEDKSNLADLPAYEPNLKYGIVVDSLVVYRDQIKRNQYLADILLKYGVDYSDIDIAARRAKPIFDVRYIRSGNHYSILCKNDSIEKVQYFIYEESPISYIVFDLRDSIHIHKGLKEVVSKRKHVSGSITSSLWNAMLESDADPNLANELSEIFAWTIDFFGVQKNDAFNVIYEELYVENQKVGLGKVLAASFEHAGENQFAFYFVQDSIGDYFDEKGGSLRRAFLKAPLTFKRISSRYSTSRLHPVLKYRRPHLGVDYAAAMGTPVLTVGDGVVDKMWRTREGGRQIRIKHNGTYSTAYLHLSAYAKGIKTGKKLRQGEVIAYVGKSGLATGPHLDFRFYRNGNAIDPLKVKSPAVQPVDSSYFDEFLIYKDFMTSELLDSIQFNLGSI